MKYIPNDELLKLFKECPCVFLTADHIIVADSSISPLLPFEKTVQQLNLEVGDAYFEGSYLFVKCKTQLTPEQITAPYQCHITKYFLALMDDNTLRQQVLRASQWFRWDTQHQFCGQCGGKLLLITGLTEKKCASCELSIFPKLSPAMMVLIHRDNEILLGRSANFRPNVYSALAGFVDLGESVEQAVHREVKEEVGLEVADLQYYGSQSWPFPDAFVIAFYARYVSGEIVIDHNELEDARWFSINHLPKLPPSFSISRYLIDNFVLKA